MAGGKETARQKMIGMMYLVLLAMLALNVSKDILDAFVIINDSLADSANNTEQKSASTLRQFEQQLALDRQKVAPFFERASIAKAHADSTVAYLERVKRHIVSYTEGFEQTMPDSMYMLKNVNGKDNYDKPTELLIGSEPAFPIETPYSARTMKRELEKYLAELSLLFDAEQDSIIRSSISEAIVLNDMKTPDGQTESWETGNFYHIPLAACVTTITKLQNDVRNAEGFALRSLFSKINEQDFKFDKIEAKVIPVSNYVLRGEPFKAEVFLAAYSTTEQPQMVLGKYDSISDVFTPFDSLEVANGLGAIDLQNNSIGLKQYDGVIKLRKPNGSLEDYHFKGEYMVAEPSVTVSAAKMNVLYRGLENPLGVSVPGVASENVKVSITGGNQLLRQADGTYNAMISPQSPAVVKVSVSAKMPDGSTKNMGEKEFRVKYLPLPYAEIGKISTSGLMSGAELEANQGIKAKYSQDFVFELSAAVKRFKVGFMVNGRFSELLSNSNLFTNKMKDVFKELKPGTELTFSEIYYTGKDGLERELNPIIIKLR